MGCLRGNVVDCRLRCLDMIAQLFFLLSSTSCRNGEGKAWAGMSGTGATGSVFLSWVELSCCVFIKLKRVSR